MDNETLFDKLGGRKFVLTLVILGVGAVIEIFGKTGLSQNMVALLLGASTVFGVANAAVTMNAAGKAAAAGASTGDEANVKADVLEGAHNTLSDHVGNLSEQFEAYVQGAGQEMSQQRAELQAQADALATATKLIKVLMKV